MITCGTEICMDDDAYCCYDDDDVLACCFSFYYYQSVWFWLAWVVLLTVIAMLCYGCYRSCGRRRRMRYRVLGQHQPPVYGSVPVVAEPAPVNPYVVNPAPAVPVAPPSYTPAQEKPPAYSPPHP